MASVQLHKSNPKPKKRTLSLKNDDGVIKITKNSGPEHDDYVKIPTGRTEAEDRDGYNIDGAEDDDNEAGEVENDNDESRDREVDMDEDDKDENEDEEDKDENEDDAGDKEQSDKTDAKREVSHGFHLVKGKMDHGMEDYVVAKSREVKGHQLGLYAIFDGHSGREVAKYLKKHLIQNILDQPDFWTSPKSAIKRAYRMADDDILENVVGSRGGSTATTAIVVDGRKLVVANVGDSRGVICKNGKAKQITVDHEPQREKDLIESRGGFVIKGPGNVQRVNGQLAMTRAFGDGKLKAHITAQPDITIEEIDNDTDFVILASDGLWKVTSNEEACDCIKEIDNAQEASEELIREAVVRDSHDDISCIVVMFH